MFYYIFFLKSQQQKMYKINMNKPSNFILQYSHTQKVIVRRKTQRSGLNMFKENICLALFIQACV